ncbi:MAG: tetratricopeptide repeat protein [Marinifilaceae bacterium]|jgi:hypothetical protein|nr:tetratricopeptide repeat protein [Marinifilaceae bacterium]
MKRLLIISVILFCGQLIYGQSIKDANRLYKRGDYKNAVDIYEKILDKDLESTALYYNLGNSYYKMNKIPDAILNYERALLLSPNNSDVRYNLALARTHLVDKIDVIPEVFFIRWFKMFVGMLSSNIWALLSMIFLFICAISFSTYKYLQKNRNVYISIMLISLFLAVCTVFFSYIQKSRLQDRDHAIVFSPVVNIKGSPADDGVDLFLLHEGTKVEIIEKRETWVNIKLKDGMEGWIRLKTIQII